MKKDSKSLFESMKKGFHRFYKEAKDDKHSQKTKRIHELERIMQLRSEKERYVNTRIYAEGGMKKIILSADKLTCRQIAMAKIKNEQFSARDLKMFLHEARILARLDHPNIVPLYDIGVDTAEQPYFTMKLLSGESLGTIIDKLQLNEEEYLKKFPLNRLLEIFLKVCDAVAFAHSRNIVHRDLKPDNIQVGNFGEVLLCDWGLAKDINLPNQSTEEIKISEIIDQQTMSGTIKGTPGYMAPEQIDDNLGEISEQTDIYALGAILYSILTLEKPLDCPDMESLTEKTLLGDIIPPSARSKKPIPIALEAVCQKAMLVKADFRYQSPNAIANEIKSYLDGFATDAQDANFRTQAILLIKRNKSTSLLIASSFLLISLIVAFFLIKLKQGEVIALNAMKEAQFQKIEKDKLSRIAAPEFHKKALEEFKFYNFESALIYSELSSNLDKQQTSSWDLLAQLQLGAHQFSQAANSFTRSLSPKGKKLALLCREMAQTEEISPLSIIQILQENDYETAIPFFIKTYYKSFEKDQQHKVATQLFRTLYSQHQGPLLQLDSKIQSLSLTLIKKTSLQNLDLFHGLALNKIDISGTLIKDIRAISNMPLTHLNLSQSAVLSLSFLADKNLQFLDISRTKITDITPLRGLPIQTLNINRTRIKNLSVILELPALELLIISKKMIISKDIVQLLQARGVTVETTE
jgi:eukaryotic-like serine/threonine-protein kinase